MTAEPDPVPLVDEAPTKQTEAAWLVEYLRERDAPCPVCEYNLRGLTSERCPECGQRLRLRVSLAEPYFAAWIAMAASMSLSAGFGLFYAAAIARAGWPPGGREALYCSIWISWIAVLLMPLVLLERTNFMRKSRSSQWVLAIAAMSVLVINTICAFVGMR